MSQRSMVLALLFLLLAPAQAWSATVRGRIIDDLGNGLGGVPVCLSFESGTRRCARVASTGPGGFYRVQNISRTGRFYVEVLSEADLGSLTRSQARVMADLVPPYANFIWSPSQVGGVLTDSTSLVARRNLTGVFSFSNYRRTLQLTAADFPELDQFDPVGDLVFLKVFATADEDTGAEELLYLGQVTAPETLLIEASLPLSITELHYDIYSLYNSVSNTISLTADLP